MRMDRRTRETGAAAEVLADSAGKTGVKSSARGTRTLLTGVGSVEKVADGAGETLGGGEAGETRVSAAETAVGGKVIFSEAKDADAAIANLTAEDLLGAPNAAAVYERKTRGALPTDG